MKRKRELGKGTFAVVEEYEHPKRGKVAVKTITGSPENPVFLREMEILNLGHPNLLSFIETQIPESKKGIQVVLPLASEDTLWEKMYDVPDLSLSQILGLIYQIACGISALHQLKILHADLKPNNILVFSWPKDKSTLPRIQIADPGLATWIKSALPNNPNDLMSTWYRPPEFFCRPSLQSDDSFQPSLKADMFSLGVILLQLLDVWITEKFDSPPWMVWGKTEETKNMVQEVPTAKRYFTDYSTDSIDKWQKNCPNISLDMKVDEKKRLGNVLLDTISSKLMQEKQKHLSPVENEVLTRLFSLTLKLLAFDPDIRPEASKVVAEIQRLYSLLKYSSLSCPSLTMSPSWHLMNELTVSPSKLEEEPPFRFVLDPDIKQQLKDWYNLLSSHFHSLKANESRKKTLLQQLYLVVQALAMYKQKHPRFPDTDMPSLFFLFLVWIAPQLDEILEKSLKEMKMNLATSLLKTLQSNRILS